MNPSALESLLLDRALNELPSETAALLDAYLAQNPAAAARASALTATLHTARAALTLSDGCPVASMPNARWRSSSVTSWFATQAGWLKLAACLALGGALGWGGARFSAREALVQTPARPRADGSAAGRVIVNSSTARSTPRFSTDTWSAALLARVEADRRAADRPATRYRLRWESPGKPPILEEKP